MSDLEGRLEAVLRRSEPLMHVLRTLARLDPPDWLVFGTTIRTVSLAEAEPGVRPLVSTLEEEGFDASDGAVLAESYFRIENLLSAAEQSPGRQISGDAIQDCGHSGCCG